MYYAVLAYLSLLLIVLKYKQNFQEINSWSNLPVCLLPFHHRMLTFFLTCFDLNGNLTATHEKIMWESFSKIKFSICHYYVFIYLFLNMNAERWVHIDRVTVSDGSWSKFTWIEREREFTFHHLRESWNQWMTIFPIFCDF